ncbi:Spore coat protein CotO [Lentibacillus halodurans]|uniref:Spore coat protein CotO n=1 Tax=Lentibacillus halodurans TaxID=237679 RepID=A0A1I0W2C2_9BACI|nr:CotO family spore coat protein [Lentibacillus halodurans]SFA82751.1 Spore coat protein CotO [Lentibacillus halodurans]
MGDKKVAKSPLLYIHQPGIQTPEAPMQSQYMTPKNKRHDKKGGSSKIKKQPVNRNLFNNQNVYEQAEEEIESSEESPELDQQDYAVEDRHQERKKFKDLTLKERVDYFLNSPKHAPVMRAEIKTAGRSYRGNIVDYQDDNVYIRVGKRTTPAKVPFDTIKEIRLIGF